MRLFVPIALLITFGYTCAGQPAAAAAAPAAYVLGAEDTIGVHVLLAPEISDRPMRIESDGYIRLPMVGRIQAGGLTAGQLENAIAQRLRSSLNDPQVSVEVVEQRSQPVSVLGAVKTPGVHQLKGPKSLVEVLSLAGGIDQEAGYTVRIRRRLEQGALPVPQARADETGQFSVADFNLEQVLDGRSPAGSLIVKPHDVISVPRAQLVYVIGEVSKPGGFVLKEKENVSVLKVLSLAGGLSRTAGPGGARVLRPAAEGGERQEIAVNLDKILAGKADDFALQPEDVLFVPNSKAKSGALRAVEAAIQLGTGIVIWRR